MNFKKSRDIFLSILIILAVVSYCLIRAEGEHIRLHLIVLLIANALVGNFFFGILPVVGTAGMMVSVTLKNRGVIFFLSFLCQFIPVYLDLFLYNKKAFTYATYYVPFIVYVILSITCFLLIIFEKTEKPDLAEELLKD